MKYLKALTERVELKIKDALHSSFCLVFDHWSTTSTHDLRIFASFRAPNENGYNTGLLAFSPLKDESHLNADEHISFVYFILKLHSKLSHNTVCLVADNVCTNKSTGNKLNPFLIG